MRAAQTRFEPAGQRFVGQQRVEVHRGFGNADPVAAGRDAAVQIGQRLAVIEPGDFGDEAFDQSQQPFGAVDEEIEQLLRVDAFLGLALVEPAFSARGVFSGRHPQQCQEIGALEMRAFFGKLRGTFALDQF
jgi:hypothetical protein